MQSKLLPKKAKNSVPNELDEIKLELLEEQRSHAREEHTLRVELLQKKIEIASLKAMVLKKQLEQ